MPTDKILNIDLTELSQESLGKLIEIKEEIVKKIERKPKSKKEKPDTEDNTVEEHDDTEETSDDTTQDDGNKDGTNNDTKKSDDTSKKEQPTKVDKEKLDDTEKPLTLKEINKEIIEKFKGIKESKQELKNITEEQKEDTKQTQDDKTIQKVQELEEKRKQTQQKIDTLTSQVKTLEDKQSKKIREKSDKEKPKESKVKDISNTESIEELSAGIGTNSIGFFVNQFKSSLPVIGPILAVSGFFINELLKLDRLQKKFLDIADTRISIFVNRQEQALLDSHLEQIIYTTTAGTTSPRDSYNSFNSYDRVLKQEGRDRDASSIGGVD